MLTLLQRLAIAAEHREDWYLEMGNTAKDGLPQVDVLMVLARDFTRTKHTMAPLIKVLLARLSGAPRPGAPAMRTVGTELIGLVPDTEAMLIQAGIESGNVASGFYNAAEYLGAQGVMRRAVISALTVPSIYVAGFVALLVFYSVKVFPAFEKGIPRWKWPASAQLLGTIADNVHFIVGGVLGLLAAIAFVIVYVGPRWVSTRRDWVDLHIPPFTILAQLNGASLLTSLACYIEAGFPITEAIKQIGRASSPYMANQCRRIEAHVRHGRPFEEGLLLLPILHSRYHWIINVNGLASDAAAAYKRIAEKVSARTQKFIRFAFDRVLSNVLLVFIGLMIMWLYTNTFAIANAAGSKRKTAGLEHGEQVAVVIYQPKRSV